MNWTKSKAFRAVGLTVAGAVASGVAVSAAPLASASPTVSQQASTLRVSGSTEGFQGRSITIRVGNAATAPVSSNVAEKRSPIIWIIKKILSALKKSFSWLKAQVVKGYKWFVSHVWNKIPKLIRWVISTGWTVYEIFKEIWNYFF